MSKLTSPHADSTQNRNADKTLHTGLNDYMFNLTLFPFLDFFADAFVIFFGFPCYNLTQFGIYFSTVLYIQSLLNKLVDLFKTVKAKVHLKRTPTVCIASGHGVFNA